MVRVRFRVTVNARSRVRFRVRFRAAANSRASVSFRLGLEEGLGLG